MQPQLQVIDSLEGLQKLTEQLKDMDIVAYDCETTGVTSSDRIIGFSICASEEIAYYVILEKWNSETNVMDPMPYLNEAKNFIMQLKEKQLLMHNAVFDCSIAEYYFKISLIESVHTDTMILAHLLDENRRVGLKELGKSMFGQNSTNEQQEMQASVFKNGGKLTKKQYEMYKADAYIMGKYGAKDAWLTYRLFLELVPQLYEQGLEKFFYEEESMPLLRGPTYQMNTTGLKVDPAAIMRLKKTLEAECVEAKAFIFNEIAPHIKDKYPGTTKTNTFNMGSGKQLAWLLFEKLELDFGTLTDKGRTICRAIGMNKVPYTPSERRQFIRQCTARVGEVYEPSAIINGKTVKAKVIKSPWDYIKSDKQTLAKLAPKYKWIQKLLEYKRKMKILTTYIKGIEERTQYGLIRPSFLQHGTTSGRYSSRNPNFQNLPRDDKRIKECIISRPGRVFVGADYSQLEPRVFAYFSGDKRLCEAFKGSDDFYSVIGMEVYDKFDCTPQKEGSPDAFGVKYKELRNLSKVIALASTYGATANKLAAVTGKSPADTQEDIDNYFERFPGVKEMMLKAHNTAKTEGKVANLFGRLRRMPEAMKIPKIYGSTPHSELPYDIRNILNLAVNHTIQSTAASIVNRAALLFDKNRQLADIDCRIVLQVHDSLIVECEEADAANVSLLLQDAMETAVELPGVALEAIPKIGRNLGEV